MLTSPRLGCLNVHASLLPRWRGAAPIQRALLAGDAETGITIMQMEEGLDTGPILMQQAVPIAPEATAAGLTGALAQLGGELIVKALDEAAAGRPDAPAAAAGGRHLCAKNLARGGPARLAADPPRSWSGGCAHSTRGRARSSNTGGEHIRVLAASVLPDTPAEPPGTVLDDRLTVACGAGMLRPLRLQRPGRAPFDAAAFLRGRPILEGTRLPCPATS